MPIHPTEWHHHDWDSSLPEYSRPYTDGLEVDEDDVVYITASGEFQWLVCDVISDPVKYQGRILVEVSPWDTADVIRTEAVHLQKVPNRKTILKDAEDYLEAMANLYAVSLYSEADDEWNHTKYDYMVEAEFGENHWVDGSPVDESPNTEGWSISKKRSYHVSSEDQEIEFNSLYDSLTRDYAAYLPNPVRKAYFEYMKAVLKEEYKSPYILWGVSGDVTVYYRAKEEE